MPIYEYFCRECRTKTEKIQGRPGEQITCPSCGEHAIRVVSVTSSAGSSPRGNCAPPPGGGFG